MPFCRAARRPRSDSPAADSPHSLLFGIPNSQFCRREIFSSKNEKRKKKHRGSVGALGAGKSDGIDGRRGAVKIEPHRFRRGDNRGKRPLARQTEGGLVAEKENRLATGCRIGEGDLNTKLLIASDEKDLSAGWNKTWSATSKYIGAASACFVGPLLTAATEWWWSSVVGKLKEED